MQGFTLCQSKMSDEKASEKVISGNCSLFLFGLVDYPSVCCLLYLLWDFTLIVFFIACSCVWVWSTNPLGASKENFKDLKHAYLYDMFDVNIVKKNNKLDFNWEHWCFRIAAYSGLGLFNGYLVWNCCQFHSEISVLAFLTVCSLSCFRVSCGCDGLGFVKVVLMCRFAPRRVLGFLRPCRFDGLGFVKVVLMCRFAPRRVLGFLRPCGYDGLGFVKVVLMCRFAPRHVKGFLCPCGYDGLGFLVVVF